MKTIKLFLLSLSFISISTIGFAQAKTEKIKVAGECGMCKGKIESAAKKSGATYANWKVDSKELTVKYSTQSNSAKIQKGIAETGYDTPKYKATEKAYNKLHECCKYDRTASTGKGCDGEKCVKAECQKDDKCATDMTCCKDNGCSEKDCCQKN
ncbi:MAG: hypothetical protein M3352_12390 [Bacteroidota bacterium]|nr:hypothetical protein [Bacteroidota bacterium]